MKNIIAIILTITIYKSYSQDVVLRHVKSVKMIEAYGGITKPGKTFGLGYLHFISDKFYINPEFNYEAGQIGSTKFKDFTGILSINYSLFNVKEKLYVNVPLGFNVGLNKIEKFTTEDKSYTFNAAQKIYYGGVTGVNVEFYINKSTALVATFKEFYMKSNPMGEWKYEILGGIRIAIN
jgi:hypothetical protein